MGNCVTWQQHGPGVPQGPPAAGQGQQQSHLERDPSLLQLVAYQPGPRTTCVRQGLGALAFPIPFICIFPSLVPGDSSHKTVGKMSSSPPHLSPTFGKKLTRCTVFVEVPVLDGAADGGSRAPAGCSLAAEGPTLPPAGETLDLSVNHPSLYSTFGGGARPMSRLFNYLNG